MLCPLCKTETRVEVREGRILYICRDPGCPRCGQEVKGGEKQ